MGRRRGRPRLVWTHLGDPPKRKKGEPPDETTQNILNTCDQMRKALRRGEFSHIPTSLLAEVNDVPGSPEASQEAKDEVMERYDAAVFQAREHQRAGALEGSKRGAQYGADATRSNAVGRREIICEINKHLIASVTANAAADRIIREWDAIPAGTGLEQERTAKLTRRGDGNKCPCKRTLITYINNN